MKRILARAGGVVVLLLGALVLLVQFRQNRTFDAPYPPLAAVDDPAVIERGRYLVFGPAHCAACHAPGEMVEKLDLEGEPPLSGGFTYPLPFGTLHFPNITPDPETGIGRYTDGEVARVLRYGVKPNGQALLPVMEYQNISDEDIVAILSYLRSRPAVRREVPATALNLMGRVLKAFVFEPVGPSGSPPAVSPPEEATVERGEYLANRVAQCAQCHTRRNMGDMSFAGPRFAGGAELNEPFAPDYTFVTPNLTPHPRTGALAGWTEDRFVERFRAGRTVEASPMMWELFQRMSDTDLRAIYRYLMSLDPVDNETRPYVRPRAADEA
ncbi:MAG: cytochrome c [Longimicrobiales bacterium]|nr:cytochrome c [Longimicrobiales bacterium]